MQSSPCNWREIKTRFVKAIFKKKKSYFNKINPSNLLGNLGKFQLTLIHINTWRDSEVAEFLYWSNQLVKEIAQQKKIHPPTISNP